MKRDPLNDTEPVTALRETTDPGPPEFGGSDPPASAVEERLRQLIQAFNRPPQRPSPNCAERAHSNGGAAVGYSATTTPSLAALEGIPRERVLLELAELSRRAREGPHAEAPVSNAARDASTAPPARERRARRGVWIIAGGAAVLAIIGAAAVGASATPTGERSVASSRATAPNVKPATEASSTASAATRPAASDSAPVTSAAPIQQTVTSSQPVQARPMRNGRVAGHASPPNGAAPFPQRPTAKPANDPTIDELDRGQ